MTSDLTAIGLMSGTSMDGIDVALLKTDGVRIGEHGGYRSYSYGDEERALLRRAMDDAASLTDRENRPGCLAQAEGVITEKHVDAVQAFLREYALKPSDVDVIGFHGQTVLHRPKKALTVQIGDGAVLARDTGICVISDMRAADMRHGGQGAPMACAYHAALAAGLPQSPCVFVNIGGISNVTWIAGIEEMLAFDTGPGNALMDDWAMKCLGKPVDHDGALAQRGQVNEAVLQHYLEQPYLQLPAPKSLDRGDFDLSRLEAAGPSAEDGMATLAQLTVACLVEAVKWFPQPPLCWVICGGGRHNRFLMRLLADQLPGRVVSAEEINLNGDAIEAEAWAYLAVRGLKDLPLSYPGTTGVDHPVTGGVLHKA